MGALPYILGGGVVLLVVAAAAKAKASSTKPSSSTTTKPTTTGGAGTTIPAYLSSVPYTIVMRVIRLSDPSAQQAQGIWLADNGYPKTGDAVQKYSRGEITEVQLRQIAQAEFNAGPTPAPAPASTKPQGTPLPDTYGSWLLVNGDNDAIYSYALTATSIPFVSQAAAQLAAAGDTRAAALTQHLADISVRLP